MSIFSKYLQIFLFFCKKKKYAQSFRFIIVKLFCFILAVLYLSCKGVSFLKFYLDRHLCTSLLVGCGTWESVTTNFFQKIFFSSLAPPFFVPFLQVHICSKVPPEALEIVEGLP